MMIITAEYILAGAPDTPAVFIEHLARVDDFHVRRRVAETSRCTPELLTQLADDNNSEVRMAAGHNMMTPLLVLEALSADSNPDVRYSLASNTHLPRFLLERLENDENPYVSCRAEKTLQQIEAVLH